MLKVEIDRSKWDVWPNKNPNSTLYKTFLSESDYADQRVCPKDGRLRNMHTGLMCCLGFVGKACGFTDLELDDKGEPSDFFEVGGPDEALNYDERWPTQLLKSDPSEPVNKLINANDDILLTNKQREARIIEWGLKADIEFSFTGEYLK